MTTKELDASRGCCALCGYRRQLDADALCSTCAEVETDTEPQYEDDLDDPTNPHDHGDQ